jgi:hypothetical protein
MYRIVLPILKAKGMPSSEKIKFEAILDIYEKLRTRRSAVIRRGKLLIMAVVIE